MAQKLLKILDVYYENGESVDPELVLSHVSNREEFIFNGAKPLELATLSIDHNWVFFVVGDIDVSRYSPSKGEQIPNFNNIAIHGKFIGSKYIKNLPFSAFELDLSKCGKDFITPDTVLPHIIYVLNCAYAIQGLDVLFNKIPETVTDIIVEAKLIKQSVLMADSEKLAIATKFATMYPNVRVRDTANKYELHKVLQDISNQQNNIIDTKPKADVQEEGTQKISEKIAGHHLDIKDIIDLCKQDIVFNEYNLSDDDLKRQIRFVLSNSPDLKKGTVLREDGVNVNYIDSSDWSVFREKLISILQVKKAGDKFAQKRISETTEEKNMSIVQSGDPNSKVIEPIVIQKYIPDAILKKIKKSSGPDKLKNILLAINEINLDIVDDVNYQGGVKIIKNGILTVSQTVKKENGCALAQSCDSNTNNDRKRLIWTFGDGPNGPVIVCLNFFEAHMDTDKQRNIYKNYLKAASKRRSFSEKELSEYKNVNDILNDDQIDEKPPIIPSSRSDR